MAACLGLTVLPAAVLKADDHGKGHHHGKRHHERGKYSRLTALWWKWVMALPTAENPTFDETGGDALNGQECGIGPGDKYIFLAGVFSTNTVTRTVTRPVGKDLFFPVVNNEWNFVEAPQFDTVLELRAYAKEGIDSAVDLHASLDGVPLEMMRVRTPVFFFILPEEDSLFATWGLPVVSGRIRPVVGDGYWVHIPALPRGHYVINFGATFPNGPGSEDDFILDITYELTVQ